MKNNKAFSFVEIIITISIIVLLAVIGVSGKKGYDDNMNNTKVLSDSETINNALESYNQENSDLPMPGGNINYYTIDTTYAHSYDDAFGVYGSLTEETISKKYLDTLPLDPRTNSYYAYGKTKSTNQFEIGTIQIMNSEPVSKIVGSYTAESGPYNLIREYNGPNFVYNGSKTNLPYNPDELILIATDKEGNVYREGDTIETTIDEKEIFFSDGSVSILDPNSKITLNKLNFKNDDNLNTIVKLGLEAGKIWTKATKLNDESEFEVYTTDSSAAVRGTIFGVIKNTNDTDNIVIEGTVDIINNNSKTIIRTLNKDESLKTESGFEKIGTTNSTTVPIFSTNTGIRSSETESSYRCPSGFELEGEGCVKADKELMEKGYKLMAYAPYNKDLNLYKKDQSKFLPEYNSLKDGDCNGHGTIIHEGYYFEICKVDENHIGIFLDNTGNETTLGQDYIKYNGLNLNEDFAIEINIKIPSGDSLKHYLIHSGYDTSDTYDDIKLYIQNGKLWLNPTSNEQYIPLGTGFNKIQVIKIGTNIFARYNGEDTPIKELINPINEILVGSSYHSYNNDYTSQLNEIIDYIKIYK